MRHFVLTAILAVVLVGVAWNVVLAGDYLTDAVQALRQTRVYVAPGTEETNQDTAAKLQGRLTSTDNIVLVMFPNSAEVELEADALTIAGRLSEMLSSQRIIGLAVGKKVVGYAPSSIFPTGVAADQMRRAQSVSNDTITTLGTFAQNIRLWQKENNLPARPTFTPTPKPTATPRPISPEEARQRNLYQTAFGIFLVVGLFTLWISSMIIVNRRREAPGSTERTRFNVPNQVRNLLKEIALLRRQVNDNELQDILFGLCQNLESYFQDSSKNKERDALFFKDRLIEVIRVINKYLEIQKIKQRGLRYFRNPDSEMSRGKSSIKNFSEYVLEAIQTGYEADLIDYRVDTNILDAQRYR